MFMKGQVKFSLGPLIISGEVFYKLKVRGFHAISLSTNDFSTHYTTVPHNVIKEKLKDLTE